MSLNTKVGGIWKDVSTAHVKVDGVWKPIANGWTKVSGVWKLVYSGLRAALTSDTYENTSSLIDPGGTPTTIFVTASLTLEGVAPFTYQWHHTGSPSTTASATESSYTLRLTANTPQSANGTVWCEVTDTYGNTVTTNVATWALTLE